MTPEQRFQEAKAESKRSYLTDSSIGIMIKNRKEAEAFRAMVGPELSYSKLNELSLVKFSWEE